MSDLNKIVDELSKLTVMEAAELSKLLQEKWGVSAAAPVAVAAAGGEAASGDQAAAKDAFDVILADNLFGDMLSDEAAMLTGSLGLLPSASLGSKDKNGRIRSLYEPVHGSAPDIEGKNIANPIVTILSLSMALRYSLDLGKEADQIDKAVQSVLDEGLRTKDIMSKNMKEVSTKDMGDAIIAKLK